MMILNECVCAGRKSYSLLLNVSQHVKITSNFVPLRTFFFKKTDKTQNINRSTKNELQLQSFKGYDDENFSEYVKHIVTHPPLLKAVGVHFLSQFSQFYSEQAEAIKNFGNYRMDDERDRVDMLFKFEKKEDLDKFIVSADSSYLLGYSSASLSFTEERTALFAGNICTDVPKDGNIAFAGYANFITKAKQKSFNRIQCFDWSQYTHLVFKIRGDGRSYLINLNMESEYVETDYFIYSHPLYTRGGPYWQITKIPFSHFFVMKKGGILNTQRGPIPLRRIQKFGISVAGNDGPFKLEIDYIGLEYDSFFNTTSPYEEYKSNA